jgi:hypothetical protein
MANAWGSYIYVYGGADDTIGHFFVDLMIRLDVTKMGAGWSFVLPAGDPAPHYVRHKGATAILNGVMYYVGGVYPYLVPATAYSAGYWLYVFVTPTSSYNPTNNVWTTTVPGATLPLAQDTSDVIEGGCLVALGDSLYFMRHTHLLRWKPGDANWTAIPTTSPPWQNSGNPSCVAYDGKVVQIVGSRAATYDPVTKAFGTLPVNYRQGTYGQSSPIAQVCGQGTASYPKGEDGEGKGGGK